MRCFLAIVLPEEIRRAIGRCLNGFRAEGGGISWVRLEGIHLTIKFLGEIETMRFQDVSTMVRETAREFPGFELTIGGRGVFPDAKQPRVLWIGVHEPPKVLADLAEALETGLSRIGFPREKHPFRAHLTAARVRPSMKGKEPERLLARWLLGPDETFGTFRTDGIVLMQSILERGGAVYTRVEEYPLAG